MNEQQMEFAEALERQLRDAALADVRAKANEAIPPDWDCRTCYDCGDDILPKARADAGKFRCINCQELKERGSKLFRR